MASPDVIRFHNENLAKERERVRIRIANGTKGSSPAVISYRRQHPDFKGIKTTNSSGNKLFFVNKSDTHAPFASEMIGGVIKDFRAAQRLLKQRAESSRNIELEKAGEPPIESPLLELSDVESRSLELNNLLQQVQDAVDAGEVSSTLLPDLKNILRLFVSLLPTYSESELGDFKQFFGDQIQVLKIKQDDENISKEESQVLRFLQKLLLVIKEFAKASKDTPAQKAIKARSIINSVFKVDFGKLRVDPAFAEEEAVGVAGEEGAPAEVPPAGAAGVADLDAIPIPDGEAMVAGLDNRARARISVEMERRVASMADRLKRENDKAGLIEMYRRILIRPQADIVDQKITEIRKRIVSNVKGASPSRQYFLVRRSRIPELVDGLGGFLVPPAGGEE